MAQSGFGHRSIKIRLQMLFPVGEDTNNAETNRVAQSREGTLQ